MSFKLLMRLIAYAILTSVGICLAMTGLVLVKHVMIFIVAFCFAALLIGSILLPFWPDTWLRRLGAQTPSADES